MVELKIYSKKELENLDKDELIKMISNLQTEVLNDSFYDGKNKELQSTIVIKLKDFN